MGNSTMNFILAKNKQQQQNPKTTKKTHPNVFIRGENYFPLAYFPFLHKKDGIVTTVVVLTADRLNAGALLTWEPSLGSL